LEEEMEDKIREKLDQLRVHLQNDGGDLEVVEIEGKTVKLRLVGACGTCPHSTMTIKEGLERILKEEIDPDIVIERVM
jgi:Fe-S cluster biogenesis protein NfuA